MRCAKCGKENPEDGKFCPECGSPMTGKRLTSAPQRTDMWSQFLRMAAKEKKALIILGCCLLLFLFFLVVFLLFVWTALRTADQRKSVSDRAVAAQMEKSAVPPESGSAE